MEKEVLDRIKITRGDITKLNVDAIVNAANSSLLGGGGVDGAIHRAAGPELLVECRQLGGCPTGEVRITRGYHLPARYVIHAVGPVYRGRPEESRLLSQCYQNALRLAEQHGLSSIAFPAISCGAYGYPIEEACKIAISTTCGFLRIHQGIQQVVFILFSEDDYRIYQKNLEYIRSSE
ncbi:MAG: O-acetyl-ADP-ribose deacetylase [Pseudomonadota bacterium]